jgi:hypothetical protein
MKKGYDGIIVLNGTKIIMKMVHTQFYVISLCDSIYIHTSSIYILFHTFSSVILIYMKTLIA